MRDDVVFLDIDTQRCFLDVRGSLPVVDGEAIRDNLRRLTDVALGRGVRILATEDVHTPGDRSMEGLPPHCILGSRETVKIHETRVTGAVRIGVEGQIRGELGEVVQSSQVVFEKRGRDPFSNPALGRVVKALPSASLFVFGVATEGSVSAACRSLLALGRAVTVVTDATRGLDQSAHQAALEELNQLGVAQATTDQVLAMLDGDDW